MKKELNTNIKCYIAKEIVSEFEKEETKRTYAKRSDRENSFCQGAIKLSEKYLFEKYSESIQEEGKEAEVTEIELKNLMTEYTSKGILRNAGAIPIGFGCEKIFSVIKRSPRICAN